MHGYMDWLTFWQLWNLSNFFGEFDLKQIHVLTLVVLCFIVQTLFKATIKATIKAIKGISRIGADLIYDFSHLTL